MKKNHSDFSPAFYIRSPILQTFLASSKNSQLKKAEFLQFAQWKLIQTEKKVQLMSSISEHPSPKARVLFLHGWEGGIDSSYILKSADFLWKHNLSILRLNLRDHGDTHHLNLGLFNGSLLEETFRAIQILSKEFSPELPLFIVGFSLGGNFALRIAKLHSTKNKKIENLRQIFSISPALNPHDATEAMDKNPILKRYFLKAWKSSLYKKQKLFPHYYNLDHLLHAKSVMDLTKNMIPAHSEFDNIHDYFSTYTIQKDFFDKLKMKVDIFASKDDPVIPIQDFYNLKPNPFLKLIITEHGGHCGFFQSWRATPYYCFHILKEISNSLD